MADILARLAPQRRGCYLLWHTSRVEAGDLAREFRRCGRSVEDGQLLKRQLPLDFTSTRL